MALILSDVVIGGQVDNRNRNSVRGWIQLRGFDRPLLVDLTGNCAEDLAGASFRFEAVETSPITSSSRAMLAQLAPRQVGPVGVMTAVGRVQVANCTAEELLRCTEIGVAPPLEWKSSLFLEWYGQNGRVIVELLNAHLQFTEAGEDELLEAEFSEACEESEVEASLAADEDDDPYGLFPEDWQLGCEGFDDMPRAAGDVDETLVSAPGSLCDEETPLQVLFDPPLKLYPADLLNDRQVEESLQVLLARLARHGVALDMCEHFSIRDAYCLLLEHILPAESIRLDWTQAGFVQHYATHEFCPECLGQFAGEDVDPAGS